MCRSLELRATSWRAMKPQSPFHLLPLLPRTRGSSRWSGLRRVPNHGADSLPILCSHWGGRREGVTVGFRGRSVP